MLTINLTTGEPNGDEVQEQRQFGQDQMRGKNIIYVIQPGIEIRHFSRWIRIRRSWKNKIRIRLRIQPEVELKKKYIYIYTGVYIVQFDHTYRHWVWADCHSHSHSPQPYYFAKHISLDFKDYEWIITMEIIRKYRCLIFLYTQLGLSHNGSKFTIFGHNWNISQSENSPSHIGRKKCPWK